MATDCLFCKISSGEIPATIRYEDEDLIAFKDIEPQAPHHLDRAAQTYLNTLDLTTADSS